MNDPVIIDIPYWHDVTVVRIRCRIEDTTMLRSIVPYQMPHFTRAEAPPALRIKVSYARRRQRNDFDLTWLHDGISYLRPLHVGRPGNDLPYAVDYQSRGTPMTLDHLRAILSFEQGIEFSRTEFPQRWLFERNPKFSGVKFNGRRVNFIEPMEVATPAEYAACVKQWIRNDEDLGAAEALRTAQRYVAVDGIVHRRVPSPFWTVSGVPDLTHGENLNTRHLSLMWPIALTADFDLFIRTHADTGHLVTAEAEYLQPHDVETDLSSLGGFTLSALWKNILQAVPYFSDANLDRFKTLRKLKDASHSSFGDCMAAFTLVADMLDDPGWNAAMKHNHDAIKRPVETHVAHWKRLLLASGNSILTTQEDDALVSLAD